MGDEEAIREIGKEVKGAVDLIRARHVGGDPEEAVRFLLKSAKALKMNDFEEALYFVKYAQEEAKSSTEYLLSNAKELASKAEKSFNDGKYEDSINLWQKAAEEYSTAGKLAEERREKNIFEGVTQVKKKINENIEKAETAIDNKEMLRLVAEGNSAVEKAESLSENNKFEEAVKAYEDAKVAFKAAQKFAEKRDFEADRKKIAEALKSIDPSIEASLLSRAHFLLNEAEVTFWAKKFAETEKLLEKTLLILEGLKIHSEELEGMKRQVRERLLMAKLEQGKEKMVSADLLIENNMYYKAKEVYKNTRSYLENLHDEASKFGFSEVEEELESLCDACSRNIFETKKALLDVSGVKPKIVAVEEVKKATFSSRWTGRCETRESSRSGTSVPIFKKIAELDKPTSSKKIPVIRTSKSPVSIDRNDSFPVDGFPKELISRYDFQAFLGEGGFAKVFLVKRKSNGELVALKIPQIKEKTSADFIKEVAAWYRLNHPNIVKLHKADFQPVPHLEVEYIEGISKDEKLFRDLDSYPKPMPEEVACDLIRQTANGLQYAHSQGVCHHDLKPLNILLKPENSGKWKIVPKITDFGLAQISARSSYSSPKGYSPNYAAPEQIDPDTYGIPDQRTDIYQLGVTFYELLSKSYPYTSCTLAALSGQICSPTIKAEAISRRKPHLAHYDGIFERMLAKKKDDRYMNISEFLEALDAIGKIQEKERDLKITLNATRMKKKEGDHTTEVLLLVEVVEKTSELALLYALSNSKAEMVINLSDLKERCNENKNELLRAISNAEYMIKENIPIGPESEFVSSLKILLDGVKKESKARISEKKDIETPTY